MDDSPAPKVGLLDQEDISSFSDVFRAYKDFMDGLSNGFMRIQKSQREADLPRFVAWMGEVMTETFPEYKEEIGDAVRRVQNIELPSSEKERMSEAIWQAYSNHSDWSGAIDTLCRALNKEALPDEDGHTLGDVLTEFKAGIAHNITRGNMTPGSAGECIQAVANIMFKTVCPAEHVEYNEHTPQEVFQVFQRVFAEYECSLASVAKGKDPKLDVA